MVSLQSNIKVTKTGIEVDKLSRVTVWILQKWHIKTYIHRPLVKTLSTPNQEKLGNSFLIILPIKIQEVCYPVTEEEKMNLMYFSEAGEMAPRVKNFLWRHNNSSTEPRIHVQVRHSNICASAGVWRKGGLSLASQSLWNRAFSVQWETISKINVDNWLFSTKRSVLKTTYK